MITITLLHTNDIHGHLTSWRGWEGEFADRDVGGFDRLATAVRKARQEVPEALLLDAGDLIGDTMIAELTEGEALMRAFNSLAYDALTIGNHEPDFGMQTLQRRIAQSACPVVACNLVFKDSGRLVTKPHVIKEVSGTKVGIVGFAYPKTNWTTAAKNVANVKFLDPVQPGRDQVRLLREQGVQIVVALTHLGLGADIHLAQHVDGIDVIVGGHSHNRMNEARSVGGTLIVQAGAHGSDLGRLDLVMENGKLVRHQRTLDPLFHDTFAADPQTEQLIESLLQPHRKQIDEVIGEAADWLIRAQTIDGQDPRKRDEQSPVDSLFADILRRETDADIAFLPGVGYGVAIPPGPITAAQLRQLLPHDGKVVRMRLAGVRVMQVLEQAIDNVFTEDVDEKVGGMIQVSGLRFAYDPNLPNGHRVLKVQLDDGDWDPGDEYTVVTNSMLAGGGHHQQAFEFGTGRQQLESEYEMVKRVFQQRQRLEPPRDQRIHQVDHDSGAAALPDLKASER